MAEIISIVSNLLDAEFIRYMVEYDNYDTQQKYGDENIIDHIVNNYSNLPKYDEYIITLIECGFNYRQYYDKFRNTLLLKFAIEKKFHIIDSIFRSLENESCYYMLQKNIYDKDIFDILSYDKSHSEAENYFYRAIKMFMNKKCYNPLIDISFKFSLFNIALEVVKCGYYDKYYYNDLKIVDTLLTYVLRNSWISSAKEIAMEIIKHCPLSYITHTDNKHIMPAIMVSAMYDHYEVVNVLLNMGANITYGSVSIFHFITLNTGIHADLIFDIVISKLTESGKRYNYKDDIEMCFKKACIYPSNKILVRHIIENYPDIFNNMRNNISHYFASKGYVDHDILKILLDNKIFLDTLNEEGETPAIIAVNHIHHNNGKNKNSIFFLDLLLDRNILWCQTNNKGDDILSYFKCAEKINNKGEICNKCNHYYSLIKQKMDIERSIWNVLAQPIAEEIIYNMQNYKV